jgi:hypothetical protein
MMPRRPALGRSPAWSEPSRAKGPTPSHGTRGLGSPGVDRLPPSSRYRFPQKVRIVLTHIFELQTDRALLRRHRPVKQPIVGPSVHPARSFGKPSEKIGASAKAHSELLRLADGAMAEICGCWLNGRFALKRPRGR